MQENTTFGTVISFLMWRLPPKKMQPIFVKVKAITYGIQSA